MSSRLLLVLGVGTWTGSTLLLSTVRWFGRVPLAARLGPYRHGGTSGRGPGGVVSLSSFGEVLRPAVAALGERLARLGGVREPLEIRLTRVHADLEPSAFRVKQVGVSVLGAGLAAVVAAALRLPATTAAVFLLGGPALGFLAVEQRLAGESAAWQRRTFLELPVVAEQLAMLLRAGWSLHGALDRIAARSSGVVGRDLSRVCRRVRQGVPDDVALREWAAVVQVPAVDRLVAVLLLDRDTGDLGRLVSEEARSARRDAHRELIEQTERRAQQVWIPVTVAALVPGVLFMAIPFVETLRLFGG